MIYHHQLIELNQIGYVRSNIIVVSMKANRIKNDATVNEIKKVADFYEKLFK